MWSLSVPSGQVIVLIAGRRNDRQHRPWHVGGCGCEAEPGAAAGAVEAGDAGSAQRGQVAVRGEFRFTGDQYAAGRLASLLAERGDLDELRAPADTGDPSATWRLASLLAERGDLDELRWYVDTGDKSAAGLLGDLLTKQGRDQDAEQLRRFCLNLDGSIACG